MPDAASKSPVPIARDFFGRPIIPVADTSPEAESKRSKKLNSEHDHAFSKLHFYNFLMISEQFMDLFMLINLFVERSVNVYFRYKEGYSNAVRRFVKMRDLE